MNVWYKKQRRRGKARDKIKTVEHSHKQENGKKRREKGNNNMLMEIQNRETEPWIKETQKRGDEKK